MTCWIMCDKCHKNVATHQVDTTPPFFSIDRAMHSDKTYSYLFLCDQCAGVEPPKSVTKLAQTGDKITTYYNKEAMTNPVTSTTYTDKQEGQK